MSKLKDCPSDLRELHNLMEYEAMKHEFKAHPIAETEDVKGIIGYNPAGEHQILIKGASIIRGVVSFGDYEIMVDDKIIRFETKEEVIAFLRGRFFNEED